MGFMMVSKWERRDAATREQIGSAAFNACREFRDHPSVTSSRYYWATPDQIVIANGSDDLSAYWSQGSASMGAALFALADVATQVSSEQWIDAGTGQKNYEDAGR
jgi:hypothetical protein